MSTDPSQTGPDEPAAPSTATEAAAQPTPEATEPTPEATEATEQPAQPTPEATEPTPEATEATEQPAQPTPEATEPTPEATEATEQPAQPTPEATEPTPEATEATEEAAEPDTSDTVSGEPHVDEPTEAHEEATEAADAEQTSPPDDGAPGTTSGSLPAPSPSVLAGSRPPAPAAPAPHPPAPAPPTTTVVPPLAVGAAAFGRVQEDGTVLVREGDAEREVGQYPDVPTDEALAFYVRKFEDLAAQVHLLGQRLDAGTVPAKEARHALSALQESTTDAKVVGDLAALRTELERLEQLVAERTRTEEAERAVAREQALAQRERIVTEAEEIAATPAASMHFKNAGERMQALLEEWKAAQRGGTRLDKKSEDPLWKRFATARSSVDRLRRAHFAQVSEQRAATKAEKEALIARAEELQNTTDWRAGSEEYRVLMDRWKAAGRLSRKDDDALWARFRAAQDVFFAARGAANAAQDDEYRGNLEVKEKLLAEAEALLPVKDVDQARRALASIQDRWDSAGRVPRSDLERIEARLRAVLEKVRDAEGAKWGRGNPEVVARGSGLVAQLQQQVADLDAKIAEAEARGDARTAARATKDRATKQAWLDQALSSLSDLSR